MEITLYRDQAILSETRHLPAETYNLARTLQKRGASGVVFVPIRSMQVLAVLDAEEFLFVDSQYKNWVMIAWRRFTPSERNTLEEPVAFESLCYTTEGQAAMKRLPREFHLALLGLANKERPDGPARLLKFEAKHPSGQT